MKTFWTSILCLALFSRAAAQDEFNPADLLQEANRWIGDNIDPQVLDALGVDKDRARRFLAELQKSFQGTSVYDLAALRESALRLQPLLAGFEETEPYALWLKAHLDYFNVTESLRQEAGPVATNRAKMPNPSAESQRRAWLKALDEKPAPATTNKYLPRLKQIFAEERVPPELVWIAEVESSFDPRARSPVGAAGMFQLMPTTARSLDLSVGLLRDERLHPEKSARAAARYLRQLHERFGDWRLALAAYNCGETRVANLLKKYKVRSYDEISGYLPVETQMYVPKLEATLRKRERIALRDLKVARG